MTLPEHGVRVVRAEISPPKPYFQSPMYTNNRLKLGEILVKMKVCSPQDIDRALLLQNSSDQRIGTILVEEGACSADSVAQALAYQLDLPLVEEIVIEDIDIKLLEPFSLSYCRNNCLLPFYKDENGVWVATDDPLNIDTLDEMRLLLGEEILPVPMPRIKLTETINLAFDYKSRQLGADLDQLDEAETPFAEEASLDMNDLLEASADDEAPVIRFVNSLFVQAVRDRASDIHIEPSEREIRVRFRVDGVLKPVTSPPRRFHASIITRVKILAGLNIAEKRIPQDGRIRIKLAGKDIDIRVATAPTVHGERVTMRLLDKSSVLLNIRDIGFSQDDLVILERMIHRPHGIILVTGPTGSGKTTTLYSSLSEINSPDKNIMTIEDPVEYQLDGISQMQTNPKINLTFASGLRSYLRHDPDVIMVGEIRDVETAENAIQASLTGHLVLSTLHTNDSAGAFTRLSDMGIEPFLVASTVILSLAQRLVRRLCNECKVAYIPTPQDLAEVGISQEDLQAHGGHVYMPREGGCSECRNLGYRGRTGIYELMPMRDDIGQLIINRSDAGTIKKVAVGHGMKTLRDDGALKILRGVTSIEEVLRVTAEDALLEE